ncbi:MAG TPA: limonene-1,2-epoxide hydrolase family protein [Dehalococcoidia bacterium]|nr:limonene-1,2-epoxide hydrolase family protein [Dehalococcoidia bacterium]
MADAGELITAFIKEFDAEHPEVQTLLDYFTDAGVYHNMPGPPATGKAEIETTLAYTQNMTSKGWEVVHQAVVGDTVINERIDRFEVGGQSVELPVCGVFEVRDGKIAAWRDYFDMATFQKQMPGG